MILLFDGVCNLCHFFVYFVIRRDKARKFQFASLQSEVAKRLLSENGEREDFAESVVLIDTTQRKTFFAAKAILKTLEELGGVWRILAKIGLILPQFLIFGIYQIIANHRYKVFGKKDTCPTPRSEWKDRFLN